MKSEDAVPYESHVERFEKMQRKIAAMEEQNKEKKRDENEEVLNGDRPAAHSASIAGANGTAG